MTDQLSLCLDSPMLGRVKNDRTMMVFNFFSLSRERVDALPVFEDPSLGVRIEVRAKGTGVATIWDKQVLIYIASLMLDKIARGEPVSQRFNFTAHDYFQGLPRIGWRLLIQCSGRRAGTPTRHPGQNQHKKGGEGEDESVLVDQQLQNPVSAGQGHWRKGDEVSHR